MDIQEGDLVIAMSAMNRSAFDFIGRFIGYENNCLMLANPLTLDYEDNRVLRRLAPLHLPLGMADVAGSRSIIGLPLDSIAYFVGLPKEGSDWMHREYDAFFKNAAPEKRPG